MPHLAPSATSSRTLDPWVFLRWFGCFLKQKGKVGVSVYPRVQARIGAGGSVSELPGCARAGMRVPEELVRRVSVCILEFGRTSLRVVRRSGFDLPRCGDIGEVGL